MKGEPKVEAERLSGNTGDAEAPERSRSQPRPRMGRAAMVMVRVSNADMERVRGITRAGVAAAVLGSLVLLHPAPSCCGRCGGAA